MAGKEGVIICHIIALDVLHRLVARVHEITATDRQTERRSAAFPPPAGSGLQGRRPTTSDRHRAGLRRRQDRSDLPRARFFLRLCLFETSAAELVERGR